jgi:hypothetical protein
MYGDTIWPPLRKMAKLDKVSISNIFMALFRRLVAGFPPRRPGFNPRSGYVGFVVDEMALRQGFLRALRFPLPVIIPPTAPYSSSSSSNIRGWYNRSNSGRRTTWTQSQALPQKREKKKRKNIFFTVITDFQ